MRRLQYSLLAACAAMLLAVGPAVAQKVTVEQNTPLYSEPRMESSQVAQLQQGATGEVIAKQGVWLNIKTAAATGWVFSFNVRFDSQAAEGSSGGSSLGRLFGPLVMNMLRKRFRTIATELDVYLALAGSTAAA